ncbi:hypothetical protein [Dongia sp.]|uniref:hypothetical protein n=1 Tax=Dongia sp. TaxID=1977262 RepID=UPI0035B12481
MAEIPRVRKLTILAEDPGVRLGGPSGPLAFAQVEVPAEELADGPTGYRVKVVDFDASANVAYFARAKYETKEGAFVDPFAATPKDLKSKASRLAYERRLLGDPNFHAQNVYAIVMRTLARFEFALGRRVHWGFDGHQIHIAPHAFCDANAFYSRSDRGLLFGYFRGKSGKIVHTSLSHDIVAHEATHALLDGLRTGFMNPSGPDVAGFHEGFADVVAMLSAFSLREVIASILSANGLRRYKGTSIRVISGRYLTRDALSKSVILGLADQMGAELQDSRGDALRRSVMLKPDKKLLSKRDYLEPHVRGEIFAAAMMRSFLALWVNRIGQLGTFGKDDYNLDMVVEEGTKVADHLLTMAIRALDYCPAIDMTYGDYLAALLTADHEVMPDDSRFAYRKTLRQTFASFGIETPTDLCETDSGTWKPFAEGEKITYRNTKYESMLHDREEVFRFIWENRDALSVDSRAYTKVLSVRPCHRLSYDGFMLRETICEYAQVAKMFGAECKSMLGVERPAGMPTTQYFTAHGGGVLIFDQHGQIKYHIAKPLHAPRQSEILQYLWDEGYLDGESGLLGSFAHLHRLRGQG